MLGRRGAAFALLRAGRSCLPVSLRDYVLRSGMENLADSLSVTTHGDITTRPELDETGSGAPMSNEQTSKVLPAGKLKPIIEGAPKDRGQHVS